MFADLKDGGPGWSTVRDEKMIRNEVEELGRGFIIESGKECGFMRSDN